MEDVGAIVHPMLAKDPISWDRSDWVILKVLDRIRSGQFRAGQRLAEEDLAEMFGVSRAPVRDAIHKLENLGIVERRKPGRRVRVREWTEADRRDILGIMEVLIKFSVELAIGRLKDEDFAAFDTILEQTREDQKTGIDDVRQIERDARIHLIIAQRSGNRWLVELMQNLMLPLQLFTRESHDYLQSEAWLRMHSELVEALRRNDPVEAAACVRANALESRALLLADDNRSPENLVTQKSASAPENR
jgi:DNA-binding GntR family transcriptional regulator